MQIQFGEKDRRRKITKDKKTKSKKIMELLNGKYAILDIEAIALSIEREDGPPRGQQANIHNCTRKFALLMHDGTEYSFELEPCLRYCDLLAEEIRSFNWARKYCHGLTYRPSRFTKSGYSCADALMLTMTLMEEHDVTVCYYKGGILETDLVGRYIQQTNLEDYGVKKSPMNLSYHSPLLEIRDYKQQLVEISCREQYNNLPPSLTDEKWD